MKKYFLFNLGLVFLNATTLKSQVANVQDSVQLVNLYQTTDGQNWTNNSGWLTPGPLRFWHGVSLNSSGRVTSISLANNNLSGVIPYLNLPALQSLLLNNNHLSDTIPNLNLPALQHLNLSVNDLTGKIPNFSLPALQTLSLVENDLTDTIPNFNLPTLKSLTLNSNQLSGNIPSFNLPALEVLYLQRNNLTGKIPALILPSLTHLSFTFNQLTDTIPIFNFPELTALNLNHNLLTGRIPNFNFPNLTVLDVSYNQLTDTIPNFNFPNLQLLHLESNQLTGTIPHFNFPALKILDLWGNQLSGNIPAFNFPVLQTLALQINGLSGPVPHFNIPATATINLGFNKLLFDGLEELKQNHPTAIYSPQAGITANKKDSTLSVTAGGTISNNEYKWYRNNQLVATITGDSNYVSSVQGFYTVSVTNSVATGLTLTSNNILEMLPPIFKIDPNPSVILSNGTIDPNLSGLNLADSVRGAATDGVTKILLYLNSSVPIKFWTASSSDGLLNTLTGTGNGTTSVTISPNANGKVIAVYTVPDGFGEDLSVVIFPLSRPALLYASSVNGIDSTTINLNLVSPPIVMVHGMWSDRKVWETGGFVQALEDAGFDKPTLADYSPFSSSTFNPSSDKSIFGRKAVHSAILEALDKLKTRKFAVTQADVIAHSLGGLMTRSYLQRDGIPAYYNYNKGPVHKLITLGTPHKGSPLGPFLFGKKNNVYYFPIEPLPGLGIYEARRMKLEEFLKNIEMPIGACHEDFDQFSNAYQSLNANSNIKAFAIAGTYKGQGSTPDNSISYATLNLILKILGKNHSEIFAAPASCGNPGSEMYSDLVVSTGSQYGDITHKRLFYNTNHSRLIPFNPLENSETTSNEIQQEVISLLLSNNLNDFATSIPAPATTADCGLRVNNLTREDSLIEPLNQSRIGEAMPYVKITSPQRGTIYQQGSSTNITLTFQAFQGAIPTEALYIIKGVGWFAAPAAAPYAVNINLPHYVPVGEIDVSVIVRDVTGVLLIDSLHVFISPDGNIQSISVNPDKIILDSTIRYKAVQVLGDYINGSTITTNDITSATTGTVYTSQQNNVFSVNENGLVTAMATGTDTLIITNSQLTVKIPITVASNFQHAYYYPNTINFPVIPDKTVGDASFSLDASATSGDDIVFTVVSGPGTIQNGILTMDTTGQITIKASQPGNVYFAAATDVTRSFCVKPIRPAIVKNCNILSSTIPDNNQWYKDGVAISGATNQNLFITSTGTYTVKVTSNGCTSDASNSIIEVPGSFVPTPEITAGSATVFCEGGNAVLTSNAAAGNQWYKDGAAISGASNTSYQASSSGAYSTKVTVGGCESAISNVISVIVNSIPPTPLISQNGNQLVSSAATGNQWYLNGVIITGATGSNYSPVASGSYTVQVSVNGCASAMSATYNFIVTGIPNIDVFGGQVNVWPNPVRDMLTITKSGSMPSLAIRLFDINGRLLVTQSANSASTVIDMRRYATGVYVLWIENISSRIKAKKMIIKL